MSRSQQRQRRRPSAQHAAGGEPEPGHDAAEPAAPRPPATQVGGAQPLHAPRRGSPSPGRGAPLAHADPFTAAATYSCIDLSAVALAAAEGRGGAPPPAEGRGRQGRRQQQQQREEEEDEEEDQAGPLGDGGGAPLEPLPTWFSTVSALEGAASDPKAEAAATAAPGRRPPPPAAPRPRTARGPAGARPSGGERQEERREEDDEEDTTYSCSSGFASACSGSPRGSSDAGGAAPGPRVHFARGAGAQPRDGGASAAAAAAAASVCCSSSISSSLSGAAGGDGSSDASLSPRTGGSEGCAAAAAGAPDLSTPRSAGAPSPRRAGAFGAFPYAPASPAPKGLPDGFALPPPHLRAVRSSPMLQLAAAAAAAAAAAEAEADPGPACRLGRSGSAPAGNRRPLSPTTTVPLSGLDGLAGGRPARDAQAAAAAAAVFLPPRRTLPARSPRSIATAALVDPTGLPAPCGPAPPAGAAPLPRPPPVRTDNGRAKLLEALLRQQRVREREAAAEERRSRDGGPGGAHAANHAGCGGACGYGARESDFSAPRPDRAREGLILVAGAAMIPHIAKVRRRAARGSAGTQGRAVPGW
jgi:hypothetical protein